MKKALHETDRRNINELEQIVNVGTCTADDLRLLGVAKPQQLVGRDPWQLYRQLCQKTQLLQDPCVLDVFMSAIDFMNGQPPRKWWEFTPIRKRQYARQLERFSI